MAESPAPAVLAGKADRHAVEQERTESEGLGKSPVVRPAGFINFTLPINHNPFYLRQEVETLWHSCQASRRSPSTFLG